MTKVEQSAEYAFFSSFPSEQHVGKVCGGSWMRSFASTYQTTAEDNIEKTCRQYSYSTGDSGEEHNCNKNGWHGKPELGANCEGILGFVLENKSRLIGNATTQEGELISSSVQEKEGVLEDISFEDGIIHVVAGDASIDIPEEKLHICVTSIGIMFSENQRSKKAESERSITVVSFKKA